MNICSKQFRVQKVDKFLLHTLMSNNLPEKSYRLEFTHLSLGEEVSVHCGPVDFRDFGFHLYY